MRKRETQPFCIPVMTVTTNLDWDDLHRFNDEFISRYSKQLSCGLDMTNVFERELATFESGIKFFEIGNEYTSEDHTVKIVCQIEEAFFGVILDGEEEYQVEIMHDEESEYFIVFRDNGKKIQFKAI